MTAVQVTAARPVRRAAGSTGRESRAVPASSSVPWLPSDALRLLVCNVLGLLLVVGAWLGVGSTAQVTAQFGWLSLVVIGFLISSVGSGAWVLTGRRTVGLRLAELLESTPLTEQLLHPAVDTHEPPPAAVVAEDARTASDLLSAVPGTARYHRAGCALVRGKSVEHTDVPGHETSGRRPCELCRPDEGAAA
ncbi:MAG: hypothetical protein JWN08_1450 [Frankiales bacterium]|nr:hypothetical protein [Frankiales bacterium]